MSTKNDNFEDLHEAFYLRTGACNAANVLKSVREGLRSLDDLELFPPANEITISSAIVFSPIGDLLRFYSLLEIALLVKCIPEPEYTDAFWLETAENLSFPLIRSYEAAGYPILLPRFLLGRLEGRLHLEEEGIEARYSDILSVYQGFISLSSQWRGPDVQIFLRFVLSRDTDRAQVDLFRSFLGNTNEFMSRILTTKATRGEYRDYLVYGFSKVLSLCDDLDRLLRDAKPFPILQSAIWNYHADLFSTSDRRLLSTLNQMVGTFADWIYYEPLPERTDALVRYIADVKNLMNRLASEAYGNSLSPEVLRPLTRV